MKTTNRRLGRLVVGAVIVSSLALSGCAYNSSSADVYTSSQAQREETVRMGIVDSVRAVKISSNNGQPSGIGAIGGGRGSILTGIVGGLAGAVAGNTIENSTAMRDGVEITVRLDNGDMRAITQSATGEIFRAGERVRLLSSGGVTRVTH